MLNATATVFIVIFALEAVVIIIGNVFTIFVFWTQRFRLKRTCFLLINLAVADILVGIAEAVDLTINTISNPGKETEKFQSLSWPLEVFGSSTSVFFLALISLERVYAVLWPLRHRVTNTRTYIYSIVIVWVAGLCFAGLSVLTIYYAEVDTVYATVTVTIASFLFISLLVICASYLTIRSRLQCGTPELEDHKHKSMEQSLRISRTFFIVIAVSLVFWLPAFVAVTIIHICSCVPPTAVQLVTVLHLGNSMVNPFVYSFRMPIFKDALRKCWRKRRENIHVRDVPRKDRKSHECESKL